MSSARTRSSSGLDGNGPGQRGAGELAAPSTSSLPPITPRRRYKRRSVAPLSSKQFDKMAKQIMQIQRQSLALQEEQTEEGEGQNSSRAAGLLADLNLKVAAAADTDAATALGSTEYPSSPLISASAGSMQGRRAFQSIQIHRTNVAADHWLQHVRGDSQAIDRLMRRPGQGLDGKALVFAAARGLSGLQDAPSDSFVHEGSFLFNPLGRRVPRQASRAAPSSSTSGVGKSSLSEPTGGQPQAEPPKTMRDEPAGSPSQENRRTDLVGMPRAVQEAAIVEDLLYVLIGIEGQLISFAPGYEPNDVASQLRGVTFTVDSSLDGTLRDLALRILPLATCYSAISAFVDLESAMHSGTVMHALCAAIRGRLRRYEELIAQLEQQLLTSPQFTLQKMWLYLQPPLHAFSLIYGFISEISAISHADILDSDTDEDVDSDDEDDSPAEDEALRKARDEMELERRQMFRVVRASGDSADGQDVEGGIVKGGEILSMLWDRIERQSGDSRSHEVFLDLFHKASQPYVNILIRWITTGILSDSYDEFIVLEDQRVTYDSLETDPSDIYWEQRYTLRDQNVLAARERERQGLSQQEQIKREQEDCHLINSGRGLFTGGARVPAFLEVWKDKILLAGKYLNVVRECGVGVDAISGNKAVSNEHEQGTVDEMLLMTEPAFLHRIDVAYQRANVQLLHLLLHEYHLMDRLRSLKHYLLFSSSDFFASFFEQADRELRKLVNPMHVRDSIKTRLQTHLGMVLGSSAVVGFSDPYKDDIKVGTSLDNPYESLKRIANTRGVKGGADAAEAIALKARIKAREKDYTAVLLDVLEFDISVQFPVSLVISRKNMIRWKFLHTILIQLKVTERQLADVWLEHKARHWQTRASEHSELEGWKMRVFRLRHRMTFFLQTVMAFFTSEVIEPNWAQLEKKIETATTVDQFLRDHTDFLNECRKECMLTDVRFVEFLQRLMNCARTFYENRSRLDDHVLMARSNWEAVKLDGQVNPEELGAEMWRALEKQESKWTRALKGFNSTVQLLATTDNPSALPLAMRLQSA